MTDGIDELTGAGIAIIIAFFGLIAYDFYLYFAKKKTISIQIYEWSKISIGVPFLIGFICGHWFW